MNNKFLCIIPLEKYAIKMYTGFLINKMRDIFFFFFDKERGGCFTQKQSVESPTRFFFLF